MVDSAVMTVENRMHEAIFTAMESGVIPRVEMAVRSFANSSGRGPSKVIHNPDREDFTENTENTSLMSTSS